MYTHVLHVCEFPDECRPPARIVVRSLTNRQEVPSSNPNLGTDV